MTPDKHFETIVARVEQSQRDVDAAFELLEQQGAKFREEMDKRRAEWQKLCDAFEAALPKEDP